MYLIITSEDCIYGVVGSFSSPSRVLSFSPRPADDDSLFVVFPRPSIVLAGALLLFLLKRPPIQLNRNFIVPLKRLRGAAASDEWKVISCNYENTTIH